MSRLVSQPAALLSFALALATGGSTQALLLQQTNLVSDIPGVAAHTDPNLVNPWGLARSATSPWWVADNGIGVSTLYNALGTQQALVVTIPPPGGSPPPSAPTGMVFNGSSAAFNGDLFIFATEGGTINGWRGALGTTAETLLLSSGGAVFKGLALGTVSGSARLFATDFHNGTIVTLDQSGAPPLTGNFTDPTLPNGFAPFGAQVIGNTLFVTYAMQDAAGHDDVAGPGNGFIDRFDMSGDFLGRFASQGELNSPWGLAVAPSTWGNLAGDLLVGNFGDGTINAFNFSTGAFLSKLVDANGQPIVDQGLWGLSFGNAGSNGSPDSLFFTAGIPGDGEVEDHGLFGVIAPVATPEPATAGSSLLAIVAVAFLAGRRKGRAV